MVAEHEHFRVLSHLSNYYPIRKRQAELMADIRLSFAVSPTVYWVGVIV
jgi:hypothetical protein